jgi:hypothetical protein
MEVLVATEFKRSLSSVTSVDVGDEHALRELVDSAERDQWLGSSIIAVRNRRPSAPRLIQEQTSWI